jgi:hypothetical protein
MKHIFRVKERITNVKEKHVVPRHPQFIFLGMVTVDSWKAKDTHTGKHVTITRRLVGEFFQFEIGYPLESCQREDDGIVGLNASSGFFLQS